MPLIELKTIKPVCDRCGRVGSTYSNIPSGEERRAVPPGWIRMRHRPGNPLYPDPVDLLCDECKPPEPGFIENDSRA